MLGARDLHTAQKGALLAGFLKILPPLIFTLPGILCFILYPGLSEPDAAFTTMVGNLLPVGLKGLIIAVLIAALVSTVDSGLNSFSTVFTLDVYVPIIKKGKAVDPQEIKRVGAIATIGAGIFATLWAIAMGGFASGMFELLQGVSSFLAPPMTALFLLTIFWRGTTSRGVIGGFLVAVAPGRALAAAFVATRADQAINVGLHDQLQHVLGDGAQKIRLAALCSQLFDQ